MDIHSVLVLGYEQEDLTVHSFQNDHGAFIVFT